MKKGAFDAIRKDVKSRGFQKYRFYTTKQES